MSDTQSNPPMYFTSLTLENIKCFGQGPHELKLTKADGTIAPWTIILGDNGVGKTTLLKCLAWMVPVEVPPKETNGAEEQSILTGLEIKPSLDDFDDEIEYERLVKSGETVSAKIEATWSYGMSFQGNPASSVQLKIGMQFERKKSKLEIILPEPKAMVAEFIQTTLFAYGAHRHTTTERNADSGELENPIFNLISEGGELYNAEELLSNYHTLSLHQGGKGKAAIRLRKIKRIIRDLLPVHLVNENSIRINPPITEDGKTRLSLVDLEIDGEWVPLLQLSLGYQTMFAFMVDLAFRMFKQYTKSKKPLSEPAVVLIDEIDLHLHPLWQREVRQKLRYHFPKTQFICTAHSPFMAQDADEENLCVIRRVDGKVEIENDPHIIQGWRIDQIATSELFGLPSARRKKDELLVAERRTLLDKGKDNLAEDETARLKELNELIGDFPSADSYESQMLQNELRELAAQLREKGVVK